MADTAREAARKARTDSYRQHILAAAERIFADQGFEAARVQDIGEMTGLSMGTIYGIFPGKGELFSAIVAERGAEILELARAVAARKLPARATLDALIGAYVGYFVEHPDFLRMHLRLGGTWTAAPAGPGRHEHFTEIHKIQNAIFRRGIAAGELIDEDPVFLNKIFTAMDQVLLADWVDSGMKADRATLVRRLETLTRRAFGR